MGNNYFQFKQFRVEQDQCAMKVTTDACIQGAWTPVHSEIKTILDIGTGTGLLSLMMAQRNQNAFVDAIELDEPSARQAQQNIAATNWGNRIRLIHADAIDYNYLKKYDLIICNPPFFTNSLLGEKQSRNIARHTVSLSFHSLFKIISTHLAPVGFASVLLPVTEHISWENLIKTNGWNIFHQLFIIPRIGEKPNRVISLCQPDSLKPVINDELIIRNKNNDYTPEFIQLMRPFYLNL